MMDDKRIRGGGTASGESGTDSPNNKAKEKSWAAYDKAADALEREETSGSASEPRESGTADSDPYGPAYTEEEYDEGSGEEYDGFAQSYAEAYDEEEDASRAAAAEYDGEDFDEPDPNEENLAEIAERILGACHSKASTAAPIRTRADRMREAAAAANAAEAGTPAADTPTAPGPAAAEPAVNGSEANDFEADSSAAAEPAAAETETDAPSPDSSPEADPPSETPSEADLVAAALAAVGLSADEVTISGLSADEPSTEGPTGTGSIGSGSFGGAQTPSAPAQNTPPAANPAAFRTGERPAVNPAYMNTAERRALRNAAMMNTAERAALREQREKAAQQARAREEAEKKKKRRTAVVASVCAVLLLGSAVGAGIGISRRNAAAPKDNLLSEQEENDSTVKDPAAASAEADGQDIAENPADGEENTPAGTPAGTEEDPGQEDPGNAGTVGEGDAPEGQNTGDPSGNGGNSGESGEPEQGSPAENDPGTGTAEPVVTAPDVTEPDDPGTGETVPDTQQPDTQEPETQEPDDPGTEDPGQNGQTPEAPPPEEPPAAEPAPSEPEPQIPATQPAAQKIRIEVDFYDRDPLIVETEPTSLGQLFTDKGITLKDGEQPSIGLWDWLTESVTCSVDLYEYEYVDETVVLPYETEEIGVDTIPRGQISSIQAGVNGEKVSHWYIAKKNGVEFDRRLEWEETTVYPQNEQYYIGVGGTLVGIDGQLYSYSWKRVCPATYYSNYELTWAGTYTGSQTVAADFSHFPLGTRIYLRNDRYDFGARVVEDTGDRLDPWQVDIWMDASNPYYPLMAAEEYVYDMVVYFLD